MRLTRMHHVIALCTTLGIGNGVYQQIKTMLNPVVQTSQGPMTGPIADGQHRILGLVVSVKDLVK